MDIRDNRTCLWTFERMHDKTAAYCIRGEHEVNTLFEVRGKGEYIDVFVKITDWLKIPYYPSMAWLN